MNLYRPPKARIAEVNETRTRLDVQVIAGLVFTAGMFLSFHLASELLISIPPIGLARQNALAFFSCLSALIAIGAAAPWWFPIAYIYRRRALLAGAVIASRQAVTRFALLSDQMTNTLVAATVIIETAGLVLIAAGGSYMAARWLGANNSFKPRPLRGSA